MMNGGVLGIIGVDGVPGSMEGGAMDGGDWQQPLLGGETMVGGVWMGGVPPP